MFLRDQKNGQNPLDKHMMEYLMIALHMRNRVENLIYSSLLFISMPTKRVIPYSKIFP